MTRRPQRVTSVELARRLGVSQSTVSRALKGDERLSSATRERVLSVARELGYKPNALARSLITRRTNIVGLVMSEIASPFYPYVLEKFTRRLHDLGWHVLLFTTAPGREVDDLLPQLLGYQVDGLIVTSAVLSSAMAEECARRGTPVVLFNRYTRSGEASFVCCDNRAGGRLVAEAFAGAGHRRPAFLAGREDTSTNRDREAGFTEALAEAGLTPMRESGGAFRYEAGLDAARRLLGRSDRPDAIFCANDAVAIGAIDAARERGLRVPEDLSVIGFDDIPQAAWLGYSLTTVGQPVEEMVELACRLLLERVESPDLGPERRLLPGELVRRGSARLAPLRVPVGAV